LRDPKKVTEIPDPQKIQQTGRRGHPTPKIPPKKISALINSLRFKHNGKRRG
jgi:hypothetical protein